MNWMDERFDSLPPGNAIIQRIPAFVSGVRPKIESFRTLDELLAIPWVIRFTDQSRTFMQWIQRVKLDAFYQFSKAERELMAEYNGGDKWWVVGHIRYPGDVDLPTWGGGRS